VAPLSWLCAATRARADEILQEQMVNVAGQEDEYLVWTRCLLQVMATHREFVR
jgi:hypothetical protein